jgi:L-threonylcarbamoyladenylate synthase
VPSHAVLRRLLKLADVPLAAPSANPFGYVSPTTAQHVREGLGTKIRYILDGGASDVGLESTIVDLRNPERPRLLRPGAISREAIATVLGRDVEVVGKLRRVSQAQIAPGLLKRHYSPHTRVVLHDRLVVTPDPRRAFVFVRKPSKRSAQPKNVFWLDARGNLRRAAHRLFDTLRQLDRQGFAELHVELAQGDGLAVAINDRLRRAAAQ